MPVQPYLFFEGRCEEALEFYKQALQAEVTAKMRFSESPDQEGCKSVPGEKIMHAQFRVAGTEVMASDGMCQKESSFEGFALSLAVTDPAEAERYFNALAKEGEVHMPLEKTFWSPLFGMVKDRFGVNWMIIVIA